MSYKLKETYDERGSIDAERIRHAADERR